MQEGMSGRCSLTLNYVTVTAAECVIEYAVDVRFTDFRLNTIMNLMTYLLFMVSGDYSCRG